MNNGNSSPVPPKKKKNILLISIRVYTVLYILFLIDFLIDNLIQGDLSTIFSAEGIGILFSAILYFAGYYYTNKSGLTAGILFITWWGIMWVIGLFIAETDRGAGVVMGFPVFIFSVLLLISWYRKRPKADVH